jgi:arginine decarboxylase
MHLLWIPCSQEEETSSGETGLHRLNSTNIQFNYKCLIKIFYSLLGSMIPKFLFLTKGVGRHKEELTSFELALRSAGIHYCNIVNVSSIIPPGCKLITKEEGLKKLQPGEITFAVLSKNSVKESHKLIAASIGIAMPSNNNRYGYLSEHHSFSQSAEEAGDHAENLAATMLATTMGIPFDHEKAWDEKKRFFKLSGMIIKTSNVTQSAVGETNGQWTTVVAAAIFLP